MGQEKTKKDPEAPKKPAGGAYGVFLAKHRADFAKDCQGQPATAVTKIASGKWKALSEEEKKSYEAEYKVKLEAYQEAMKAYKPASKDEEDEPVAKKPRGRPRKAELLGA